MSADDASKTPVRQYIEEALQYAGGTHTVDDVLAAIEAGTMQLWTGPSTAIVTELVDYPRKRVINFFLAGGERNTLAEFEQLVPVILDWAHEQGCSSALFTGRRGWERTFLSRTGWTPANLVVLEKSLNG